MRFSVLGPIAVDDGAVPLSRPRDRAVLAALLVDAGRVVSVPALIARVWGEDAGDATLASLHVSISRLRKALKGTTIATESPGYRIAVGRDDLDADRFADRFAAARAADAAGDAAGARERVAEALALWRGEPYADVVADFAEQEAARLWDLRLAALELEGELDLRLGRHLDLVDRLPALVAAHPLREGVRATLMVALYRAERQAEALELYEQTRERFADELGIDPSPVLQRLHAMVLRHDPELRAPAPPVAARPAPAAAPAPAASPRPGMVGREAELGQLRTAWHHAAAGTPGTVLVTGEAGIGKTRLLEELAAEAAGQGADVVWGRCTNGGGAGAYWPWAEALSRLAASRSEETVRAAVSGRGAPAAALLLERPEGVDLPALDDGPLAARQRLFDGVVAALAAFAADRPVLVVLEDAHWADDETALLTDYVLHTLSAVPLLLAVSVRDPDLGTVGRDLAASASRSATTVTVTLGGLGVEHVRAYASERLETEVGPGVAERLHRRTDGNPFFIAELVRLLTAERAAGGRADVDVPRTVHAVLERRLAHLEPGVRRVLGAAAVLGREVDLRVLAAMLGTDPLELADAVDSASAAGVLEPAEGGRYRFTHALVQETLLAGQGPMRRAALHASAAAAVEAHAGGAPERAAAEIARHLVAAGAVGDPGKAVRFSILAATAATARTAYGEAEQHLVRAVALVDANPGTAAADLELEARNRLAELLTLTLGYNAQPVIDERRRAFRLAVDSGEPLQLLSALWGAWGIALISGELPEAEEQALRMGDAAGDHPLLALAHDLALGQLRWHQGRLPESRDLLESAVIRADAEGDRIPLDVFAQHPAVCARAWLAMVLTLIGEDGAEEVAAEAGRIGAAAGHAYTSAYLDVLESWRAMWARRPRDAMRTAARGLDTSLAHGFHQMSAFSLAIHGWSLAVTGDAEPGVGEIRRSIDAFEALPTANTSGHLLHGVLAEALLESGDEDGALNETRIALAESERTGETFMVPAVHLVAATAHHRRGTPAPAAAGHLDEARAQARLQGSALFVARTDEVRDALAGKPRASVG